MPFSIPPLSIAEANAEYRRDLQPRNLVVVGSYGYDRSLVCLHRSRETVTCHYGEDFTRVRQSWVSFEQWLKDEVTRLGLLFDENGKCLVSEQMLLPAAAKPN
jgi:hypothetical protein